MRYLLLLWSSLWGVQSLRLPATKLIFEAPARAVARKHILCGRRAQLLSPGARDLLPIGLPFARWKYLVEMADADAGNEGASCTWMFTAADGKPSTIVAAVLPDVCSRHASPVRPHSVTSLVKGSKSADVVVLLEDSLLAGGTACAIGRAFPLFSAKSSRAPGSSAVGEVEGEQGTTLRIGFATSDGAILGGYPSYLAAAEGVRRAARLVDLPPDVLTTSAFVGEAQAAARRLASKGHAIDVSVLSGTELRDAGYGFLWGVGKAAEEPPALVVLSYVPDAASLERAVCLVGKGVVYDSALRTHTAPPAGQRMLILCTTSIRAPSCPCSAWMHPHAWMHLHRPGVPARYRSLGSHSWWSLAQVEGGHARHEIRLRGSCSPTGRLRGCNRNWSRWAGSPPCSLPCRERHRLWRAA